ncbi:MAG: orotidine-5'-phosphate decarboxylase [Acidobacteriota bacterium]
MNQLLREKVNPLVVALDVETGEQALTLVRQLKGLAGMFKVGKQLFTSEGPSIVRRIVELGEEVFLDLKFHDIPSTVAKAAVEATRLGVSIFNLHALGGRAMMVMTVDSVKEATDRLGVRAPIILGVTVLTSHDEESLREVGVSRTIEDEVACLASLCDSAGVDGVVASALEIEPVRRAVKRPDFVVLVPGIRPAGTVHDDQSRVLTPGQAIRLGATYLVVGRPITAAADPVAAAEKIVEEIELAVAGGV